MWKSYFGENAKIYGIDIDPKCKELEENNIKIFIGSQSDRTFLREIKKTIPPIDILIDDGGHGMIQQIISYEELFDHVKENGVYLCEDLHTSYWLRFGGGYKRKGTFIEYSKNFIDQLNAYHSQQKGLSVSKFTDSVDSLHFYDSILVIEKKKKLELSNESSGTESFQRQSQPQNLNIFVRAKMKATRLYITRTNQLLRFFKLRGFIWK